MRKLSGKPGRPRVAPQIEAAITEAAEGGMVRARIARMLGVAPQTVKRVLTDNFMMPGQVKPSPQRQPQAVVTADYEVPAWVRPQYVERFHQVAQIEGEEEAACVCRRLKAAEMRL